MNLSKYYLHLVKIIICVIALPCFIFGIYINSEKLLAITCGLCIVFLAFDICEYIIIDRKNRKNIKKFGILRKNEYLLNTIAGKSYFKTLKLLAEKQNQLEALSITSEKFNSTIEIENIIKYVYDVFKKFTGCDRCLICFKDVNSQDIYCKYELGEIVFEEVGKYFDEDSVVTQCFNTNSVVVKCGIEIKRRGTLGDKLVIPLNISDEQLGVIFLETRNKYSFKRVNLTFLQSLANYAAVAMYKSQLINDVYIQKQEIEALYEETAAVNDDLNYNIDNLNRTKDELRQKNEELQRYSDSLNTGYIQTVMSLVNAIEAKDAYTSGHCQRVMEISCEIAARMKLDEDTIQDLRYAAILHDIGKIGVSASILNKPDKLTDCEYEEIKKHPLISYNILKNVEFLRNGLKAILEHHEKYNGGGYPNGLKGEEISLLGRILCIADAFDAMTSDRTYRRGMTMELAINEIERCKGIQFDPRISELFINMIKELINN